MRWGQAETNVSIGPDSVTMTVQGWHWWKSLVFEGKLYQLLDLKSKLRQLSHMGKPSTSQF